MNFCEEPWWLVVIISLLVCVFIVLIVLMIRDIKDAKKDEQKFEQKRNEKAKSIKEQKSKGIVEQKGEKGTITVNPIENQTFETPTVSQPSEQIDDAGERQEETIPLLASPEEEQTKNTTPKTAKTTAQKAKPKSNKSQQKTASQKKTTKKQTASSNQKTVKKEPAKKSKAKTEKSKKPVQKKTAEKPKETKQTLGDFIVAYDREKLSWTVQRQGSVKVSRRTATKQEATKIAKELSKINNVGVKILNMDGKKSK